MVHVQWFAIQRGCRQGDPISPYVFILCLETLAIIITQNKNIKGIFIGQTKYTVANDTEITLEGDRNSLKKQLKPSTCLGKHQVAS